MTQMQVEDPPVHVRSLDDPGRWSIWHLSQDLTDRWGEINDTDREHKPLEALLKDQDLLPRLRSQMWDEATFIVRKDGNFGILFEVEYASQESEASSFDAEEADRYLPHPVLLDRLIDGARKLQAAFSQAEFAIPHESNIYRNRLAVWAFVADGALSAQQRGEIGTTLLRL